MSKSTRVINLKQELTNDIFKLNNSTDIKSKNDEMFSPERQKEPKNSVEFKEEKNKRNIGGSQKIISDMKNIFEL